MRRRAGFILIALCLSAPSLWMMATIPPLWKTVDAYLQLTAPPGHTTILHYGPAYSFLARLPLYLGHAYDCLRVGLAIPTTAFFARPVLSDSGVFLLLVLQHAGLVSAVALLILAAAQSLSVRLTLAIFWAANPFTYVAAHCVGSETFSLLLILLLAGAGLSLFKSQGRIRPRRWLLFASLLWLSILTRHINSLLAALLPLGFGLTALLRLGTSFWQNSIRRRSLLRARSRRDAGHALAACALGVACVVLAAATLRVLTWATNSPRHSSLGYTFTTRLGFLVTLSPEERERVIARAEERTSAEAVRKILNLLRIQPKPGMTDHGAIMKAELSVLSPEERTFENFAAAQNGVARAFLVPPSGALVRAGFSDFVESQHSNIRDVVRRLLSATAYFFDHPEAMPACAHLTTYRDYSRSDIRHLMSKHPYLGLWKKLRHGRVLLAALLCFAIVAWRFRGRAAALHAYPVALVLTGLAMVLANCLLVTFRPRFAIPMWGLTLAAMTLLLGSIGEIVAAWLRGFVRAKR